MQNSRSQSHLPDSHSERSHLSTRDLLFDRDGLVYMVVRRHAVSMRTSDFHLNASQILKAARAERNKWLGKLKRRGVGSSGAEQGSSDYWVPFPDGAFLCQAVGLVDDLKPLLSYPPLLPPSNRVQNYLLTRQKNRRRPIGANTRDGYAGPSCDNDMEPLLSYPPLLPPPIADTRDGYAGLSCDDKQIVYQPSKRMINATHLVKLEEISRNMLPDFFAKNPQITKEIRRGGDSQIQGTYISFEDAQVLCAHFNLFSTSVQGLLTAKSVSGEGDDCIKELFGNGTDEHLYGLDYLSDNPKAVTESQPREPDQLLTKSENLLELLPSLS